MIILLVLMFWAALLALGFAIGGSTYGLMLGLIMISMWHVGMLVIVRLSDTE
jgi:hypothetical protein